jgi:hypothetical protein
MKKKWLILSLVGLLLIALTSSAFAWSPKLEGKPDQFHPGGAKGYYIWHDDKGFHIWTATRGAEHVFSGVIRTDGNFAHVRGNRLEKDDSFKDYSDRDDRHWFIVSGKNDKKHFIAKGRNVDYANDKISFKFETAGGSDGINFRVKDGSSVTFELYMDGERVNPREIYIGDHGYHPNRSKFTIKDNTNSDHKPSGYWIHK